MRRDPEGPELTIVDISAWVGSPSYERGMEYARSGRISTPRRQGGVLKAECQGREPEPYRVEAGLGASGIEHASCSCPLGGGHCKHVAALLFTWLDDPGAFREVEETGNALERCSKEQLIALIERMIARHSDLEMLIEIETGRPGSGEPVAAEWVRRQALGAFGRAGGDWRASYRSASDLRQLLGPGVTCRLRQEWESAFNLYGAVARAIMEEYNTVHDEEGELVLVLAECAEGLTACLAAGDPALRNAVLRALKEELLSAGL